MDKVTNNLLLVLWDVLQALNYSRFETNTTNYSTTNVAIECAGLVVFAALPLIHK
jgi:hypothetical protein